RSPVAAARQLLGEPRRQGYRQVAGVLREARVPGRRWKPGEALARPAERGSPKRPLPGLVDEELAYLQPGLDRDKKTLPACDDVRDIQQTLKSRGLTL